MRDNAGMRENIRFVFMALWLPATGILFATGLTFVFTLGEYAIYFFAALITWAVITGAVVISCFD